MLLCEANWKKEKKKAASARDDAMAIGGPKTAMGYTEATIMECERNSIF